MKSEPIAVRATSQYRRRDILAYLGLRYYLNNDCARRDVWARDVSTHLILTREAPTYHRSYHFKDITNEDEIVLRNIYLPGPNEMIAEAALIQACAREESFKSQDCVYSYSFPAESSKEGIFLNYFPGFQSRNNSIKKACQSSISQSNLVRYTDIKKFYPTITHELALRAWHTACDSSNLSDTYCELGVVLLNQHNNISQLHSEGSGLLTGPMFSHLIANLVLAEVDKKIFKYMGGNYWRYVDDFVLFGSYRQVEDGRKELTSLLGAMGFDLHSEDKDFFVGALEWLKESDSLNRLDSKSWVSLIANVKRFLVVNSEKRLDLRDALFQVEINIPLLDYSAAVEESTYLESFSDWLSKYFWSSRLVNDLTIDSLVKDALQAREFYMVRMAKALEEDSAVEGYKRKQLISKLRFYAKRLSYLATPEQLASLSEKLAEYPELRLEAVIMRAVYDHDVTFLIRLGSNAVQSAAQIFRIQKAKAFCSTQSFDEIQLQGLAILRVNGIEITFIDNVEPQNMLDPLNQFALGLNKSELMKSHDLFIKELSCLRGIEPLLRHTEILDSAFDRDEQLSFDIIDQLQASSYF